MHLAPLSDREWSIIPEPGVVKAVTRINKKQWALSFSTKLAAVHFLTNGPKYFLFKRSLHDS